MTTRRYWSPSAHDQERPAPTEPSPHQPSDRRPDRSITDEALEWALVASCGLSIVGAGHHIGCDTGPLLSGCMTREKHPASPFRPGSAAQPPVLAGREDLLRSAETLTATGGNGRSSFQVLYGPRGVGKTVVIDRYAQIAESRDWAVARHEARAPDDPIEAIIEGLHASRGLTKRLARELAELRDRWGQETQEVRLGVYRRSATRERTPRRPPPERFAEAVANVASEVTEQRRGVMILIDEVQEVPVDVLAGFGPVIQAMQRRPELTVAVVFAGLPSAPGMITEAFSYAERMSFHALGNLTEAETAHALVMPAYDAGRRFEPDALDALVRSTHGYPYFVQLHGDCTWTAAGNNATITVAHVNEGIAAARADNERGLYLARWSKVPRAERSYLTAMAGLSTTDPVATAAIALALGKRVTDVSELRQRLIGRGILVSPRRGTVESMVPGFLDYVLDVDDADPNP